MPVCGPARADAEGPAHPIFSRHSRSLRLINPDAQTKNRRYTQVHLITFDHFIVSDSSSSVSEFQDCKMNGRMGRRGYKEPMLTRMVTSVFKFVRVAEFEILFFLFFFIAFLIFKDLTSRPEYNQILVKKPGGINLWPY